jgi:hypothetical protein
MYNYEYIEICFVDLYCMYCIEFHEWPLYSVTLYTKF